MTEDYHTFLRNVTLAGLVMAPILIALPPRKLDWYTFSLATAFVVSADYQSKERTGSGLWGHISRPFASHGDSLPTLRALEIQKEQQRWAPLEKDKDTSLLEQKVKALWMGNETEGWQERRLKEECDRLAQGESYTSMIMDQIWEVWNWGESKGEMQRKRAERLSKLREKMEQKRREADYKSKRELFDKVFEGEDEEKKRYLWEKVVEEEKMKDRGLKED